MLKKILVIAIALMLIGLVGCSAISKSATTETTPPASIRAVREAKIGKTWIVKQLEIDLQSDVAIILKLKEGDKVDGYYYMEKGDTAGLNISGNSLIYSARAPDADTRLTSDRFSFTASQAQGVAYTLTFSPGPAGGSKAGTTTIFLELIYPATGSLFIPLGTK